MGTVSMPALPAAPPSASVAAVAAGYAQLAGMVADGASRCATIVESMTADGLHGRAVAAALRSRMDCIGDLAAFGHEPGLHGQAPADDGAARRAHAVAAALRELNASVVHATRLLDEGRRLRSAQREIVADIQGCLLRTERHVRGMARDTDALAKYVSSVASGR